jgi:glycosyltransferase involved in cell wall biosynthesis
MTIEAADVRLVEKSEPETGVVPRRILNVVRFPIGGIRSYLRYTYPLLDPRAYEATVVTVDDPEAHLLPAGMAPIRVRLRLVPEKQAILRLAVETSRELRDARYDLVHSQGTSAALLSWPAVMRRRLPHVVTLHETFRSEQFAGAGGALKRRLIGKVFDSADALITVSSDAKSNLLEHIPLAREAEQKLHVIRNGVAVELVLAESQRRPDLRAKFNIADDVVVLGYVGRFMPEKGFDVLIRAVRRLHDSGLRKFIVVAMNDGAYVREYKDEIKGLGIECSFVFTGFHSSAAGTLADLDAVIMPSRREACPMLAMEAMVLGCPLIASDCIGLRQLTSGSPALTSVAGDPASLADAIQLFLSSRERAKQQARSFMATAQTLFDSSQTAASLQSVFEKVLARG